MNVPPVESFEQSLPDRKGGDGERKEREASAHSQSRYAHDEVRISEQARAMANESRFVDTVLARMARRFDAREAVEASGANEAIVPGRSKPIDRLARSTQRNATSDPLPADSAARRILVGIAALVDSVDRDEHPPAQRDELRINIAHELEEALADARAALIETETLDEALANGIEEAQARVRIGLEHLFARTETAG